MNILWHCLSLRLEQKLTFSRSGGLVFPSLSEFSTVYCDPHSQRLGTVSKAEVDVFLKFSCFSGDAADVGNWLLCLFQIQLEHLEVLGSCTVEAWLGEL